MNIKESASWNIGKTMLDCPECKDGLMVYLKPDYETLSGRETVVQYPAIWECIKCHYTIGGYDFDQ